MIINVLIVQLYSGTVEPRYKEVRYNKNRPQQGNSAGPSSP